MVAGCARKCPKLTINLDGKYLRSSFAFEFTTVVGLVSYFWPGANEVWSSSHCAAIVIVLSVCLNVYLHSWAFHTKFKTMKLADKT